MVVFICACCGDSVKKNAVDKHWQMVCRHQPPLSCIDCGKQFSGVSFRSHNACMTEQEKWHGKDFKPKEGNTGKKKQDTWTENIQEAINGAQGKNPKIHSALQRLLNYENVPRKENKFKNFLANCVKISDPVTVSAIWSIVSVVKQNTETSKMERNGDGVQKLVEPVVVVNERSEKRKQDSDSVTEPKPKISKTDAPIADLDVAARNTQHETPSESVPKFKWKKIITNVLSQSKKGSLKKKKLQRKVINEYSTHHNIPFEQSVHVVEKFEKYLSRYPDLFLLQETTVTLVQTQV